MTENFKTLDKAEQVSPPEKSGTGDNMKSAAVEGGEESARAAVDYRNRRIAGERDRDTANLLPPPPEFFDSSKELPADALLNQSGSRGDAGKVVKDEKGVKEVHYPGGRTATVERDVAGNPEKIAYSDGTTWTRQVDPSRPSGEQVYWSETKNGRKGQVLNGEMEVRDNGDILAKERGGYTQIARPDGSITELKQDNSEVTTDANDRVTSVKYPGQKEECPFKYDQNGKLNEFTDKDGNTWSKRQIGIDGQDVWDCTNSRQEPKHEGNFIGKVEVTPDGDVVRTQDRSTKLVHPDGRPSHESEAVYEGKHTELTRTDGSREKTLEDNSRIYTDADGKVTRIRRPDQKSSTTFEYDGTELKKVKDADGTTYEKYGGKWHKYDKKGGSAYVSDVQVTSDGDLVVVDRDNVKTITHSNGSRVKSK